jgi:RimJ/RimL family protein N-acetyltransferase
MVELRPLEMDDADAIGAWASDPEFCRAAGWSVTKSPDEHVRFHQQVILQPPDALVRLGAIMGDQLIGYVDLHGDEPMRRELGFVIGVRDNWHRGYGRATAIAGLRYGFEQLGLNEIWAEALDANHGSIRILQRIDMREIGVGERGMYLGAPTHYRRFVIERTEWDRARSANTN